MPTAARYTIGLMSGTSLDGVDGVLVDFASTPLRVIAASSRPFSVDFRAELLALNQAGGINELHRAAVAGNQLALLYAGVVSDLMALPEVALLGKAVINAIGAHGQTVRHQPPAPGVQQTVAANVGCGSAMPSPYFYTLQLNQPALLAELTGMAVVADFRSRDLAAGGQGAPLVPAFHQEVFGALDESVSVLNIGGMANLSILPPSRASQSDPSSHQPVTGFDCGPGNALMDAWCQQQTGHAYDAGGAWAAQGHILPDLLASLLATPFFAKPSPKSTGRDDFSAGWMAGKLAPFLASAKPVDIQATLTELTASACISCMGSYAKESKKLIVCGGGAFNHHLLCRIQAGLPDVSVVTSDAFGLPAQQVEAVAFAWLARQTLLGLPGNVPSVTGAAGLRVLGAIYPA